MPTPLLERLIKEHQRRRGPGDYVLTDEGVKDRDRKRNMREKGRDRAWTPPTINELLDEKKWSKKPGSGVRKPDPRGNPIVRGMEAYQAGKEKQKEPGWSVRKDDGKTPQPELKELLGTTKSKTETKSKKKPNKLGLDTTKSNTPTGGKGKKDKKDALAGNWKRTAASMALGGLEAVSRVKKAQHEDDMNLYKERLRTRAAMNRSLSNLANIYSTIRL